MTARAKLTEGPVGRQLLTLAAPMLGGTFAMTAIRRPCIYGLSTEMLRQCWIAYAGRPVGCCTVTSSDIIVAAQETGEVVFCGSASDEG